MRFEHEAFDNAKQKMEKSLAVFKKDLSYIRAGRANPQLLDGITIDYYGTQTPLGQVGNISAPEPRLLVISLWDAKLIPEVEKAIQKSNIGINPINDGKVIRLVVPELTEERRKELAKSIRKMGEEAKIAIRSIRREANDEFRKSKKVSEITEDDCIALENDVQALTDESTKTIDEIVREKEKEIMSI